MKQPKDIMRGKAWDCAIGAIEFGSEPEQYFRTIKYEKLAPSRQCGMAAAAAKRGMKTTLEK
jgi:hypothetical protein